MPIPSTVFRTLLRCLALAMGVAAGGVWASEAPLWFDAGRPRLQAWQAVELLAGAPGHGLIAEDYGVDALGLQVAEAAQAPSLDDAAHAVISELKASRSPIPGYGHPLHKARDPRVDRLIAVATQAGANLRYVEIAQAIERVIPGITGKDLRMNVSAAIPAVLMGVGFPVRSLRGVPILARTAGLIAHLAEEAETPAGFALSYQATRELQYDGEVPTGFGGKA